MQSPQGQRSPTTGACTDRAVRILAVADSVIKVIFGSLSTLAPFSAARFDDRTHCRTVVGRRTHRRLVRPRRAHRDLDTTGAPRGAARSGHVSPCCPSLAPTDQCVLLRHRQFRRSVPP